MNGSLPAPETAVSPFVWVFSVVVSLTIVLTLMVIRRRHQRWLTVGVSLLSMVILAAGWIYLMVPPWAPSVTEPGVLTLCPYARVIWSNMPADIDATWQACRRVARFQLALTLLGISAVTVATAVGAVRIWHPNETVPAEAGAVSPPG